MSTKSLCYLKEKLLTLSIKTKKALNESLYKKDIIIEVALILLAGGRK